MDTTRWRPLDPARSWHLGVRVAAGTTAVVGLSLLIGGVATTLAWGFLAGSAALAGGARFLVPADVVAGRGGIILQYLWSVAGVVAAAVFASALEGGIFRYGLVFAIAAVAGGGIYPPLAHALFRLLVLVLMVLSWVVRPAGVTGPQVALYIGLFATVLYLVGELSGDLRRTLAEESRTRAVLDDRIRVLRMVGKAATLDADRVFDVVVDAVVACGFDIANIGVVQDGVRYAVATRGIDEAVPPAPANQGIAGRALREGRTVVVDDYPNDPDRLPHRGEVRGAVATPIQSGRGVSGVLIGGRTVPGVPSVEDVEMLELLALHAGHALAVASQYEDEQRVVAQLRELDQMKRDFVSNVSHELRTPLTVVKGLGRTLATRGDALDPGQVAELLDRINANIRRLGAMLGGLLDFNRAGGQLRLEPRPVDLPTLVKEVVSRFEPMLDRHRVDLDLPAVAIVHADPPMIEHVLENLLGNVAKHTPPGTSVVVSVREAGGAVEIAVRDDGPGIAPADIPRLTQRYYRGAASDGVVEGSGVGLSLVKEILEAHGSHLDIESDASGTTFAFRLPRLSGVPA